MKEFLRMFGQYAVSKGEGWRVGEGAELVDAYEATLNAPADRAPLTYDQEHAIKEGHRNKAEDDYFNTRPQVDHNMNRVYFKGGFDRGWDAAKKDASADRDVMRLAIIAMREASAALDHLRREHWMHWSHSDKEMCEHAKFHLDASVRSAGVVPTPPAEQPFGRESREAKWNDRLLGIIAIAYQILGALNAPVHILDVLSDPLGATDEQIDAMLPFAPAEQPEGPARTGWPEGMLQDDSRELSKALASKPNARAEARSAAEQQGEQKSASKLLGELLAVVHRDGGHYQAEFGTAKAVADAAQIVFSHSTTLAELRAKVEALPNMTAYDRWCRKDAVLALLGDRP